LKKVKESKVCVLFVEDDEYARAEVSTRLEVWGYEPESASTMNEAMRLAKERKYDLILLDWYYRDGTGIGLCEAIRSFDAQTPILFYTGVALWQKLQRVKNAGGQGFISKPIEKDEFIKTVKVYIPEQSAFDTGS
jgi:DNA-binding response OmpR family regulator